MISEQKFANSFSSFWNATTPLIEGYIHELNEDVRHYGDPVKSSATGKFSALFAEMAFELFAEAVDLGKRAIPKFEPHSVKLQSKHRIGTLLRTQQKLHRFSKENNAEIRAIANNLLNYHLSYINKKVEFRPLFKGCGIVNECEGDAIWANTLIEVKAVKRKFFTSDLRQMLVYLALRRADSKPMFSRLLLINPRQGIAKFVSTKSMALEVSGMDLHTLLDEIVLYMSDLSVVLVPSVENDVGQF